MTTEAERRELAAFLRSRRRRRSPADAGLVTGRRRSPGLRREDVAALAGGERDLLLLAGAGP